MTDKEDQRKILVDADACPVRGIITETAKRHGLKVLLFVDTSHILEDDYAEVVVIGRGRDAVDFALINRTHKGDIVVTQDYGLAAMVCARGARAIHPSGLIYTRDNLDLLLFERHLNAKIRRAGGRHAGPRRRNQSDNIRFERAFEGLCLVE
jgi:uncharacterized protein YaiI (UPF0178 family)